MLVPISRQEHLRHFYFLFFFKVASWKYDKRPINGAPFVYFCTELISREEEENSCYDNNNNDSNNGNKMQSIYSYTKNVLNALDVKWEKKKLL